MRFICLGLLALTGCAQPLTRVAPALDTDSAMYVVVLGPDTSYMQWMVRHGNDLRMQIVERIPRVRSLRTTAVLNPDGSVAKLERLAYLPSSADTSPVERATVRFESDSTIFETSTRSTKSRFASSGHSHIILGPYNAVGLPVLARYVPNRVGDSVVSLHIGGTFGDRRLLIKRIAVDTFLVASRHMGEVMVHVGADGHSNGFNALASSLNTVGTRAPWLPVDSVRKAFAEVERAKGVAGVASPRDTALASIGGATLAVDYGRPSKRGRQLFGGIVPWNRVWRTGANEATQLTTDRALLFGSMELPAGRYTLWTMPAPNGWTFIVNNQTDQWGTEYDSSFDRFRLPMASSALSEPVEKFTIGIHPAAGGGLIELRWDTVQASVPFTVAR